MGISRSRRHPRRAGSSDNHWQGSATPLGFQSTDNCYDAQAVQQQFADQNMTCIPDYAAWENIENLPEMNLHTLTRSSGGLLPIHPLLSRRNFQVSRASHDMTEVFENCPGFPYDDLKQVLYLATCLIAVGIPFWHTVLQGKLQQILNARQRCYEFVDESEFCFGASKNETEALLTKLAAYVKFEVSQEPEAESSTVPGEEIKNAGNDFKHGKKSIIYLSQRKVHAATVAAHSFEPLIKAAAFFDLARDMVHELTHAAIFAARGNYWRPRAGEMSWERAKLLFKGSPVAEEVYEFEHRVLGGRIEFVPDDQSERPVYYWVNGQLSTFHCKVVSVDRPQQNIRYLYDDLTAKAGLRSEGAPLFQAWYVGMEHICKLFQANFWYQVGNHNMQILPLRSSHPVEYRYPSAQRVSCYAPLESPRLAQEAGWVEAESRPTMELHEYSINGLPRGVSAVWRVLEQRQHVGGNECVELMDIDGGFVYQGHGDPKVVKSTIWETRGYQ